MKERCVSYLRQCHNSKEGGFSGAPFIMSHVASTYAAVMAIVNIGTEEAYNLVDLSLMKKYLISIKNNHSHHNDDPNLYSYLSNQDFN
jgi:prenyltransferase beta subunit